MYRCAMTRGPPMLYLLVCFLSRPILSHTFRYHSFGLSAKCSCLPLSRGTNSPVTVHPASLLLHLPCLPTLQGKTWSPWQPQQARFSHSPQYPNLKKIVIAEIREWWYIQCGYVEKRNIKGSNDPHGCLQGTDIRFRFE